VSQPPIRPPTLLAAAAGRLRGLARRVRGRAARAGPEPIAAGGVALLAGLAVFAVAATVFEHHSSNHDEAVYLQQASLLLAGRLELYAGDLAGGVRPWFFVADGGRLYPKYAPVPAAMYAASMAAFGEPRVALAAVAAGNAWLVSRLGALTAGERVGVVAAALFAASPLALVTTAVFLPYAPTTLLNLTFAVAYLRGVREPSTAAAAAAGVAVGLAFFARPYTAVLFASPFVLHAGWRVLRAVRADGLRPLPGTVRRQGLTALVGLLFVGVTLAYNARLTGSPLVFPYEAFAPLDGPGFGRREILGHAVVYTPELALRANGYALWYLLTRWLFAGGLGALLAVAGLAVAARRWAVAAPDAPDRLVGALLIGVVAAVVAGNVPFWGTYNLLGTMSDPADGLVGQFGPFYHFDALAPLSVFGAVGLVAAARGLAGSVRAAVGRRASPRAARAAVLALLAVSGLLLAGAAGAAVAPPIDRNAAYAEKYDAAYGPIERAEFEDALVFVPTPYGDWLNHPFQYLRNDPGLDGPAVYVLDRGPAADFRALDAYPDRTYYRYTYRGEWTPDPDRHVTPRLERLDVRRGDALAGAAVVGVPDRVTRATVRLEGPDGEAVAYTVTDPGRTVTAEWTANATAARLHAPDGAPDPGDAGGTVPLPAVGELALTVTLAQPDGGTLTYRQETAVRTDGGTVEAVWPPERSVCPLVRDCGREGTYLPEDPGAHRDGVSFDVRLETVEESD